MPGKKGIDTDEFVLPELPPLPGEEKKDVLSRFRAVFGKRQGQQKQAPPQAQLKAKVKLSAKDEETLISLENEIPERGFNECVDPDLGLWLSNGIEVRSLEGLLNAVGRMDDRLFSNHISARQNDFSTWVQDAVRNTKLAKELRKVKAKKEFLDVMEKARAQELRDAAPGKPQLQRVQAIKPAILSVTKERHSPQPQSRAQVTVATPALDTVVKQNPQAASKKKETCAQPLIPVAKGDAKKQAVPLKILQPFTTLKPSVPAAQAQKDRAPLAISEPPTITLPPPAPVTKEIRQAQQRNAAKELEQLSHAIPQPRHKARAMIPQVAIQDTAPQIKPVLSVALPKEVAAKEATPSIPPQAGKEEMKKGRTAPLTGAIAAPPAKAKEKKAPLEQRISKPEDHKEAVRHLIKQARDKLDADDLDASKILYTRLKDRFSKIHDKDREKRKLHYDLLELEADMRLKSM